MALSKAEILARAKSYERKTEAVNVPELGEGATIRVRELTAAEQAPLVAMITDTQLGIQGATERFNVLIVVKSAVNDDGTRMFTDEDEKEVGELPNAVVARVSVAAARISGLSSRGKPVEETAKN